MGRYVRSNALCFVVLKIWSTTGLNFLNHRVSSGQVISIKIIFFAYYKHGDYADIKIIPRILVVRKTEHFLQLFPPS